MCKAFAKGLCARKREGAVWCGEAEGFFWVRRKNRREMSVESAYPELFLLSFFPFNVDVTGLTAICI